MAKRERLGFGQASLGGASVVCGLLVLYAFPVHASQLFDRDLLRFLLFIAGTSGLAWLVAVQIRRMVVGSGSKHGKRMVGVLSLVSITTCFFALVYYVIEVNSSAQFDGLETRTDALYYSVVTLGTVGYGDIHAVGQIARVATIVQVVFDLIAIGALLAVASSLVAERISERGP